VGSPESVPIAPPPEEILAHVLEIVAAPWKGSKVDALSRAHDIEADRGPDRWVAVDHESGYHWFLWAGLSRADLASAEGVLRDGLAHAFGPPDDEVRHPDGGHTAAWQVGGLIIELYLHAGRPAGDILRPPISPLVQLGITQNAES
jgi:hypothetical protein